MSLGQKEFQTYTGIEIENMINLYLFISQRRDKMKRIFAIYLALLFLVGCSSVPATYQFPNRNEPIESIELLYYPFFDDADEEFMSFEVVRILEPQETEVFMDKLYSLKTKKARFSILCDYGKYIARVNYENGDSEYFGTMHIELVENGSKAYAVGSYYFAGDSFENLFLEYAGDFEYSKNK